MIHVHLVETLQNFPQAKELETRSLWNITMIGTEGSEHECP